MTNGVVRAASGVRAEVPQVRWDPGARYRPSLLRAQPAPAVAPAVVQPDDVAATWSLPGRLFRGPARRTAVFDRRLWAAALPTSRLLHVVGRAVKMTP